VAVSLLWKTTLMPGSESSRSFHLTSSAWDVDQFHLEKQTHLSFGSASIVENGPLRGVIGTSLRIGQSSIEVQVSMRLSSADVRSSWMPSQPHSRPTPEA
jgi:hypothetical protein